MLKAFSSMGLNGGSNKSPETKKYSKDKSISPDLQLQSKDVCIRIVHVGGREEMYPYAVPASHLMEKYPGTCVAKPEVFRNSLESILSPDENLLPGNKYLIIPCSTARKLKQSHTNKAKSKDELSHVNITQDSSRDVSEEPVFSAKEFYASNDKWTPCSSKKSRSIRSMKPFVPPLPKTRSFKGFGWEPSLTSVPELSP